MNPRQGLPSEQHSVFDTRSLDDIYAEVQRVYTSTQLPWVIGYSGGKDSTATLQIVWAALAPLPREELRWPIYVIASDTLVETPVIVDYLNGTLRRINEAAQEQGIPFEAQKVSPQTTDTFWVNMIGRGYPAPNQRFRWCTERMKIMPANRFILNRAAEFGEVVMVLGGRKSESASRAQVMTNKHAKITGSRLSRHHILSRAYVYTPVEDFTTDDVWTYLLQVPSPWGNNNRDLAALYRSAQGGECPPTWSEKLHALGEIDWSRSNTILWEGRAMVLGKMSKATNSVKLSTSAIKHILGLPLTQDEQDLETLLSSKQAA